MNNKEYILIYTDFGDTCDGLARVSGKFKTREEANSMMQEDIALYCKANPELITTEADDNHVIIGDEENGCQWQILEV